ncbi:hypothetical protein OKW23_001465 [Bacilli bacterium PM5-9]|nr:hypothetical protein [Bacilli bacterium PM5-9]
MPPYRSIYRNNKISDKAKRNYMILRIILIFAIAILSFVLNFIM